MGTLLGIVGGAFMLGLALRRFRLLWVIVGLAATHAVWIVLTGRETSEDSTATLLVLNAAFIYAPTLGGAFAGLMLGRLVHIPHGDRYSGSRP